MRMRLDPSRALHLCVAFAVLVTLGIAYRQLSQLYDNTSTAPLRQPASPAKKPADLLLVAASQRKDDTSWLHDVFPQWDKIIYVTDDPRATNKVPADRGRESMVYLTYIIDHYDSLPKIILFHHANKWQWHNDDPLYDGVRVLSRLQVPYIEQQGYVNLRCVWTLGCPVEIRPVEASTHKDTAPVDNTAIYYKEAFEELFPELPMPETVGVACCGQFAVTAERIRRRPREDYERYRKWLLNTTLMDHVSGRIMEYSWHMIFGEDSVFCPSASECYCNVFGLCNLTCEEVGRCDSQYTLPPFSSLPDGWPDYGWQGEWRNVTEMREKQALDYTPHS